MHDSHGRLGLGRRVEHSPGGAAPRRVPFPQVSQEVVRKHIDDYARMGMFGHGCTPYPGVYGSADGSALDLPHMRRWAAELGRTSLLEHALQEAGIAV